MACYFSGLGLANTLTLYTELAASQLAGSGTRASKQRPVIVTRGRVPGTRSDNHILRKLDPMTNLPMHLSFVTVGTISMGRLEEQLGPS